MSIADFNRAFADTIRRKDKFKLKTDTPLALTSKPTLRDNGNTFDVFGNYPTTISGRNVPFQVRYIRENDEWKTLGIYVNPDNLPASEK